MGVLAPGPAIPIHKKGVQKRIRTHDLAQTIRYLCNATLFPLYKVEHNGSLEYLWVPRAIPIHI